jgi:capsular polysaccharide export protein
MKSNDSEACPNAAAQILLLQGKAEVEAVWSFRKQSASQRLPKLALVKNNDPPSASGLNLKSLNLDKRSVCHGNPALEQLAGISSLLMLQGPVGPLFSRIAAWKRDMGHQVRRVIFNSGDAGFCGDKDAIFYRQGPDEWREQLHSYCRWYDIQGVVLFGQTRFYHRQAIELCQRMGIPVFVVEEGYVRPGFVTLEMTGVNASSTTLKTHVLSVEGTTHDLPPAATRAYRFKLIFCAMRYYLRLKVGSWWYPHYVHHRDSTIWDYVKYWVRAGAAYPYTRWQDKRELKRLDKSKPYFFVPMQLDSDAQILFHSRYNDVMAFVDEVLESFAAHATDNSQLLIKQHPLARGHLDTRQRVLCKAANLGIAHRVIFVHACKIYRLLEGVAGVVTVNSTVGVQTIAHAAPLKIMGEAIYDHPDVADSQPLDSFWRNPFRPNPDRAKAFHQQLKLLTQMPAALYDGPRVPLRWSELLGQPRGKLQ